MGKSVRRESVDRSFVLQDVSLESLPAPYLHGKVTTEAGLFVCNERSFGLRGSIIVCGGGDNVFLEGG
jgi:hypothetical protein